MHTCIHAHTHTHTHTHKDTHTCIHACIHIHTYTYIYRYLVPGAPAAQGGTVRGAHCSRARHVRARRRTGYGAGRSTRCWRLCVCDPPRLCVCDPPRRSRRYPLALEMGSCQKFSKISSTGTLYRKHTRSLIFPEFLVSLYFIFPTQSNKKFWGVVVCVAVLELNPKP
jgi:hypothetical protein